MPKTKASVLPKAQAAAANKPEPVCFDKSESVEKLAKSLIANYHPELANLEIAYLWKNKAMQKGGKEVIASISKASALVKSLTGYDVILIASYPNFSPLTDKQKKACIDHELSHVMVDEDIAGNPKIQIVAHDVEEFGAIIDRYGLYMADLITLGRVVQKVMIREANGSKKVVKLRPGEDPVERAIAEHDLDDEELTDDAMPSDDDE